MKTQPSSDATLDKFNLSQPYYENNSSNHCKCDKKKIIIISILIGIVVIAGIIIVVAVLSKKGGENSSKRTPIFSDDEDKEEEEEEKEEEEEEEPKIPDIIINYNRDELRFFTIEKNISSIMKGEEQDKEQSNTFHYLCIFGIRNQTENEQPKDLFYEGFFAILNHTY